MADGRKPRLRKVATFRDEREKLSAEVYRDADWDEYRVKFFRNGALMEGADYHTGEKPDALSTARTHCGLVR